MFSKVLVFTSKVSQFFNRYATFHFVLTSVLIRNQLMSTKKQFSSLCKLHSVYEERLEKISDETDVDSYFYHNILDNSQSDHQIVWVSKGSNKKFYAFKFTAAVYSQRIRQHFRKKMSLHMTVWVNFSKSFWSSKQNIAGSITQTQVWDRIYKSKRRTAQSLLQR